MILSEPSVPSGFDYSLALLKIRAKMTYQEIAEYIGYESANGVYKVISGSIPNHKVGEAIYILYFEMFGEKPK